MAIRAYHRDSLDQSLEDYGCDLVVFFHTSGINRNLFIPSERQRLISVFGEKRFAILQQACEAQPKKRSEQIIGAFKDAALEAGAKFVLPLRCIFPNKRLLSHHLVFLTKAQLGFSKMKEVMYSISVKEDTIATWTYSDGVEAAGQVQNFSFTGPMADLRSLLLAGLKNRSLSVGEIIDRLDKREYLYVPANVKAALLWLKRQGRIEIVPKRAEKLRKGTLPDSAMIRLV